MADRNANNKRVLVIGDDLDVRQRIADELDRQGLDAAKIAHGEEARRWIASTDVSLVILDVPRANDEALALVRAWREQRPTMPLIVLTSQGDNGATEDVTNSLRLGANDFVRKPIDPQRLIASVRNALVQGALRAELVSLRRAVQTTEDGLVDDTVDTAKSGSLKPDDIVPFREEERRILLRALHATKWCVQDAARRLQIGRATLYRKIDKHNLRDFAPSK